MRQCPSSTTVPAYTEVPSSRRTGSGSPVIELSLTRTTPSTTTPSSGTTSPWRKTTRSPSATSATGRLTSTPSTLTQTLSTLSDILSARLSTDLRRVHSSKVSPIPNKYITAPAVDTSPRNKDTVIATPSNTSTVNLRCHNMDTAFLANFKALNQDHTILTGAGNNIFFPKYMRV